MCKWVGFPVQVPQAVGLWTPGWDLKAWFWFLLAVWSGTGRFDDLSFRIPFV